MSITRPGIYNFTFLFVGKKFSEPHSCPYPADTMQMRQNVLEVIKQPIPDQPGANGV